MAKIMKIWGLAAAATLSATSAFAHTGVGSVHGFTAGFSHPLFGLDHLTAMVAVGLWAGLVGGKARFAYPAAFVGTMVLAGIWGMSGMPLPGVEIGIGLSVVALGLAIAFNVAPPLAAGVAVCALFAIFHGHAHGAELPEDASGFTYAAGFVVATMSLHGIGLVLATLLATHAPRLTRLAGGAMAVAGVAFLAG